MKNCFTWLSASRELTAHDRHVLHTLKNMFIWLSVLLLADHVVSMLDIDLVCKTIMTLNIFLLALVIVTRPLITQLLTQKRT